MSVALRTRAHHSFVGAVLLLCAQGSFANPVADYFKNVDTLQARFTQVLFDAAEIPTEQSKGTITVQRPDRFHLEYTEPYHQIYVADGQRLWAYDEDLEQVTVKKQAGTLANSPAMLLSNPQGLTDNYTVTKLEGAGPDRFELTPKRADSNFERLLLSFADGRLRYMELHDSFGQMTRLEFEQMKKNPLVDPELFRFKPPAGVDIITEDNL
ncbi:MAG: outer membrane lipoprotein chaperone LolA [Pseudomonadota bacterium]|nr:MAG: outer membrane lipoprotein chaperone LolA [Pseudomonadota bacterium]